MTTSPSKPSDEAERLTPREIVRELDRYIVGQRAAKRAVAVALRNRWRRQQLPPELRDEVAPKNIIMIGPTGVGKTEIARRLARLTRSPFLKIEASKFTEVGYVGRDVESIVRDLTELGVKLVKEEKSRQVRSVAERNARERILDTLLPDSRHAPSRPAFVAAPPAEEPPTETRDKLGRWLDEGRLEEREIEVDVKEQSFPSFEIFTPQGVEEMGVNVKDMLPGLFGGRSKRKKMRIGDAREILIAEEAEKLVDQQNVAREAIERVEQSGMVFLDEIDKIAGRQHASSGGPDVSREGVQRDLLPIVEGTTVNTKYGMVKTDHILFIAAGAFHVAKPSDLIPELQGRFPIRVELESLTEDDFVRILREPKNALTMQYTALLATEGVTLSFTEDAIAEIARFAAIVNEKTENIGARRLHTILERLLDELSFEASDMNGVEVNVDAAYVQRVLADVVKNEDLSRYVL
ncbi:MAG TPA: ATP-dependent protease ATPase subunit HslU [Thermoanaerobaculia bacterium]|nr:ATP-dependent protease ATPase subunit HslU [Thermoanaerobaculia bacterium]